MPSEDPCTQNGQEKDQGTGTPKIRATDIDASTLKNERDEIKQILDNSKPALIFVALICSVLIIVVLIIYAAQFGPQQSSSHEHWGQFGDFIGGLFNPVFGFISLLAILFTITIQLRALLLNAKELAATREEMTESRKAQSTIAEDNKANAIVELFQTYTTPYFYDLSRSAWNVLVAATESEAYERHLLSTLFAHTNQFPVLIHSSLLSEIKKHFEQDHPASQLNKSIRNR